jgi:hypothetical protein
MYYINTNDIETDKMQIIIYTVVLSIMFYRVIVFIIFLRSSNFAL